jgi:hypothetical protein
MYQFLNRATLKNVLKDFPEDDNIPAETWAYWGITAQTN